MRFAIALVLVLAIGAGSAVAEPGFTGRRITNNAFMPTGYSLHANEFTVGIGSIEFGITENVQAGTNILLWAFQIYNGSAKFSYEMDDDKALGIGIGLVSLSLDVDDADSGDDEVGFLGISPYAAFSVDLSEKTTAHFAGQYSHFSSDSDDDDIEDVEANAAVQGSSVFAGLEHSLSPRTKLVFDGGYDATFEGARVSGGFLWGWERFRLKLGVSYFAAGDGFTFPLIGLWWRFEA